jgi:hypothetical protein
MGNQFPYAERIMQRFSVLYGNQKVRAMYSEDDNAIMAANETWDGYLRSIKPEVIQRVLQALPSLNREWPPNLSEFIGMCRDFDRVEQRVNIPLPAPKHVTEEGRKTLQRMKEMLASKVVR